VPTGHILLIVYQFWTPLILPVARNDPGRLSKRWYRGVLAAGLSEEQYVETVSVVAHVVAIDAMPRSLGFDLRSRPKAGHRNTDPPASNRAPHGSRGSSPRI
jgi:hypothetical protein